jgi:tetratricopeptide repeat protein
MKRFLPIFVLVAVAAVCAAGTKNSTRLFESAKQFDDENRFDMALPLYLKADSAYVAEKQNESAEYARSLHNTGRAYLNLNNIEKGREYTLKAVQLREKLFGKVSKDYITSLNNYALSFLIFGEPSEALKYQTEVVGLCRKMTPAHPNEGEYLVNLGRAYHALGNDKEATKCMEEAMPMVEKFGTNYEYILNFLGMVYSESSDNENAHRIMGLMEEHNLNELKKECNTPECHLDRAEYYMVTGNTAKAKDEFMLAFGMPMTDSQKSMTYEKYAMFLYNEHDFAQAGDYYNMASEMMEKSDGISEQSTLLAQHAARCYYIAKEFEKSIAVHKKVIAAVDDHHFPEKLKTSSLVGLGNALSAEKKYEASIATFRQLIQYLKETGQESQVEYAKAYERLAASEKFKGNYDESIADYEKAIELYGNLGMFDEQEQAQTGLTMCRAYAHRENNDAGNNTAATEQRKAKLQKIIRESMNELEQSGNYLGKLSAAQSYATIAGTYSLLEDYENAIKYYAMYIPAIREAIAEDFLLKSPKERELTWKRELTNIEEMNTMLALLPDNQVLYSKLSQLIYDGQLLSKGILLSSNVEFDKVLAYNGTDEMKMQYDKIKKNLELIASMKEQRMPVDEILALTRETDAIQLELARKNAEFADFMQYLRIESANITEALDNDAVAIEFVTLDTDVLTEQDIIVAVAVCKEFPSGIAIPVSYVKIVKGIIADSDKYSNDTYGNVIWGPLLSLLSGKTKFFFAPDGLLNNIAIENLSVNGRPLSEQYEMSRLSSTRELVREHNAHSLQYASLFGGIDYMGEGDAATDKRDYVSQRGSDGKRFLPLKETEREVKEITKILKKRTKKTFDYTGTKASKEELLSQEKLPLNILHIATHGKFIEDSKASDANAMDNSILAFAGADLYIDYKNNAGVVTATEIADMSLHDCDMVVLSACESGLGKLGDDGVMGLQRGFKNAGVSTLLVSLNEVADAATADMMISFYRNLFANKGLTKREALAEAQAEIRSKYPDDDTWASFILIDSFN